MISKIVARLTGKHKPQPHPRRHYSYSAAPEGIDNILNANLAAGRLVWGW